MSDFNIDEEIDKLLDKMVDQLKVKLKKMVVRSEKQVLKQYVASQKTSTKGPGRPRASKESTNKEPKRTVHKREEDYSSGSDSDSE